ncbi:MAG: MarR family EPS-associated transcriptional regulator [Candidatus Omnitrophica bacterium]|nr:MarR family EPS-associated transcriptional regulator [Candidatus Omnitrophota bacterium]MDD5591939.1 MarR family EPS-associated transcriptional regulator [Candidatus Omnitrophota bacterium]
MNNSIKIFDSEKTLHVLKEIEHNPQITQRDLAQKLEISLGKINFLINALIDKGIIEIKNFKNAKNKLAYRYLLTPQGIKIKLQLTYKFFIWKTQEYERLKEEIERLKKETPSILSKEELI